MVGVGRDSDSLAHEELVSMNSTSDTASSLLASLGGSCIGAFPYGRISTMTKGTTTTKARNYQEHDLKMIEPHCGFLSCFTIHD